MIFQIEKGTVIIPLHSPDDSYEELVISDSDSNFTRAVVHVSYEPNQVEKDLTKKLSDSNVALNHNQILYELVNKNKVADSIVTNTKIINEDIENSRMIMNNLVKLEDASITSRLSR